MRKRYIVVKETPEVKVGGILEEECDDGDQDFRLITPEHMKFDDQSSVVYTRQAMEQKEWFQEVQNIWLTPEQIEQIKEKLGLKKVQASTKRGRPRKAKR